MNAETFQNMAPNAKRAFMVFVIFGVIAVVLYMFAVQPADSQLTAARKKLTELKDRQNLMTADLKRSDLVKKDLDELSAQMKPYEEALLVPSLNSYSMRAKSLIEPLALGAGLKDMLYSDEPFRALPLPKPMPRQLHTRAAVRMTAVGSYPQAVSFLLRLEKEFPLVSVQAVDLTVQGNNPETQQISIIVEWPAKGGLTRK